MCPPSAALGRSLGSAVTAQTLPCVVIVLLCAAALGHARLVTLEMLPSMTTQEERLDAVVAEAVAGDRDALRRVLETIRPIVVRYCRARVGTIERTGLSADDVAQEVC